LLLWFVEVVASVILVAGVVDAVVSKVDEEMIDTVDVEQDTRSLKLFMLRDMPLAPSIVLPLVDRQSVFTFSSPFSSQLDTSLLRGCSRKNPDEAPEDSAFLFEDVAFIFEDVAFIFEDVAFIFEDVAFIFEDVAFIFEDVAFIFEDLNEVEGGDVTTVNVIISPNYSFVVVDVCVFVCVYI